MPNPWHIEIVSAVSSAVNAALCVSPQFSHICFVLSFVLALILHSFILVLTGAVKEHELAEFPQRKLLLLFGKLTEIYS